MYQGSDLEGIPETHGVYSLVRKIKNQRSTPWVYTGLSNDLLMRVKTHLTQQTGTYSGNKNAASIMLDRLTNVRWWDISNIECLELRNFASNIFKHADAHHFGFCQNNIFRKIPT